MKLKSISLIALALALPLAGASALDIVWTNTAGGNWSTAASWSPNQVPGTNDAAWITNNGTYTITLNVSTNIAGLWLGGTSGTQTLSHTTYTLALNGPGGSSAHGVYTLASGTLTGSGAMVLDGPFSWNGGTLGGIGSNLLVTANGGLTLGGSTKSLRGQLINQGAATWSGGTVNSYPDSVFSNAPSATLDLKADAGFLAQVSGGGVFVNAGTLRKTAGTGTTSVLVPLANSGLVQASTGTLNLTPLDSTGSFAAAAGTTLAFSLGGTPATFAPSASLTGAGNLTVTAPAAYYLTNYGAFNLSGTTTVSGGMMILAGDSTMTNNALIVNGGTLVLNGTGTATLASLTLSSGGLQGDLPLTVQGPFAWTGGWLGSAGSTQVVTANGGLAISGGPGKYLYSTVVNNGAATWSGGTIGCYQDATFSNTPAATFDLTGDGAAFSVPSGTPSFANAGLLRKTAGTGATTFYLPCANSGTVQVNSGTLTMIPSDSSGNFSPAAGTTLTFNLKGDCTFAPSSSITGAGNFSVTAPAGFYVTNYGVFNIGGTNTFSGGAMIFTGDCTITNTPLIVNGGKVSFTGTGLVTPSLLSLSIGSLQGSLPVTVTGPLNWTGGTLGSAGIAQVITANGGLTMGGAGKVLYAKLVNNGAATWSAGSVGFNPGGVLSNAASGTLDFTADNQAFTLQSGNASLVNAGLLRKTSGTGTTTIAPPCANTGVIQADTGTLSFSGGVVQTSGQTLLNGGNLACSPLLQLRGGTLSGSGTITGSVSNNATISFGGSPGLLTISGNYTEGLAAHLQAKLGGASPGTGYDQLSVGISAKLAGTLNLSYWNGYTPGAGNVFTVVVCTARSGAFSAFTAPTNTLGTVYTAKSVLVETGNASPVARLDVDPVQIACHTFQVQASASDPDGSVTNLSLLLETNVLASVAGASAQVSVSYDFPGDVTLTALATDNKGAMGATNVIVNVGTLPPLVLDPIGFQTNRAFKLCMAGDTGTNYQLFASDDLAATNWTLLGSMQNTNGIWRYSDTTASNSAHRAYRARQLP